MTGRNDPCPCGSGLKFKRCCIDKKPRSRSLSLEFAAPVKLDKAALDLETGEVSMYSEGRRIHPKIATTEVTYEGKSRQKVVAQAPLNVLAPVADVNRAITQHDIIYAVDTNYPEKRPHEVAVTGVVLGKPNASASEGVVIVHFSPIMCIEFRGANADAERIGWAEVIRGVVANPQFDPKSKVLLIVDAHRGSIGSINNRSEPVIGNLWLPENFTLMYASSDKRNDSVPNRMLHLADVQATDVLDRYATKSNDENLIGVEGREYELRRVWRL